MSGTVDDRVLITSGSARLLVEGAAIDSALALSYIPAAQVVDSPPAEDRVADALLRVVQDGPLLRLEYPLCEMRAGDPHEPVRFAEFMLERARQERGEYCINSSSASKGDRGVIFFGNQPDIGKTTLAMAAARRGFAFLSDEKTLLSGGRIIGGIHDIDMRKNWQSRYGRGLIGAETMLPTASSASIALLVVPYIDGGTSSVEKWAPEKTSWHLMEELSRKIRGVNRYYAGGTRIAPSIDTDGLSSARVAYVRSIAERIPCYGIRGTPDRILDSIEGLL